MTHMHAARRPLALVAGACAMALALTACSGSDGDSPSADGAKITLTVGTFNEFGYDKADLYQQYMDDHPNIIIKQNKAATSDEQRDKITTKIAAGSGLSDIEAVDGDWIPELLQFSDKFVDLSSSDLDGRWPDWVQQHATDTNGTLIGDATDLGPEAVCYRADLFADAGLPTDRDEVAKLLGGSDATWDTYFDVGKKYVKNSGGKAWFDSAGATFNGMVFQVANAYEESDGTARPSLDDDTQVKAIYDKVLQASVDDDLSAHLGQWSPDWTAAFQNGDFATMLCPAWITTVIEDSAKGVDGWDIADVFPGGGGNWGGSYLTVPAQSKHPEEAKALAAWLTAPEQTAKVFTEVGNFPSQVEAQKNPDVLAATQKFFNDAPTGKIFADRSAAVDVVTFKGPHYFAIQKTVQDAISKVDIDQSEDAATAWQGAKSDFDALGIDD